MKKIKKIALLFGIGLTLITPVFGLIPATQGKAFAAPVDEASTDEEVKSYVYARAIAHCIDDQGTSAQTFSDDKADEFKFLGDSDTFIGYLDGGDDGKIDCDEDWVSKAYDIWGMGESNDGQTAACYSGFNRINDDDSDEQASVCARGTGSFENSGNKRKTAEAFIKNVTRIYYGKESTTLPALSKAGEYLYYSQNFIKLCKFSDTGRVTSDYGPGELADNGDLIYMTAPDGVTETVYQAGDKSTGDQVTIGLDGSKADAGEKKEKCGVLAELARGDQRPQAYATANSVEPGTTTTSGSGSASGEEDITADCGGGLTDLNWIFCPLINKAIDLANRLEDSVAGYLCIDEGSIFEGAASTCGVGGGNNNAASSTAFKNAWNVFRIMALGLIAIAGLVMIFSQALGFEIVDAYTIKKTLPRLLVAGIGISLSWPLLEFLVTLSNGLGIGVRSLIYAPFTSSGIDDVGILSGGSAAISTIFGIAALKIYGILGSLSFIITGALALFIAFFTLVIRNMLVIFLIIFSPIAIAAYVLPNTEKYWKLWWEWLFKGLMVFPIITAMIAIGHVFAAITYEEGGGFVTTFVVFAAFFAPYFLIPAAFRFAGGALATIGGFANDRSRGAFDRLSKFRKGQGEKRMGYYGQKYGDRVMQKRAEAVRGLNEMASKDGRSRVGSAALRYAGRQVGGLGDIEERMSAIQARASKRAGDQIATGKDDSYRGLTVDMGAANGSAEEQRDLRSRWQAEQEAAKLENRKAGSVTSANGLTRIGGDGTVQYQSLGGGWVDKADVENAHREYKGDVGAQQAALSYEMRKAMENGQVEGLSERFQTAADTWGMTGRQRQGAWIGAGFENQNQHLEYKHTKFNDDGSSYVDYAAMSKEAYEKKGSYQLGQMSGHTIEQMTEGHKQSSKERASAEAARDAARASGNQDEVTKQERIMAEKQATMDRLKGVSETFMHQMGSIPGEDGAPPVPVPGAAEAAVSGKPPARTVNSNGAAAVNEAVYRLAQQTGVITSAPNNPQSPGSPQTNPPVQQTRRSTPQGSGGSGLSLPGSDDFNIPPGSLPRG